ncbi:MAG: cytochrome C [Deltaproteobacteria bacterium]|nr:cytochrome C [Deltaproteobacteria bacterium]
MDNSIKKRLWLSNILALVAMALLLGTYTLKPVFEYRDPVAMDEDDEVEENESFQPFSFLIPEDVEHYEPPKSLIPLMGDRIWEYHPTGFYAYLIGYKTMPVWKVSLEAPQYPKAAFPDGIPVFYHLTDWTGKVNEMNTINHYIGMDRMEVGAITVRRVIPFVYLWFFVMLIIYFFYKGPCWWLLGIIPAFIPWYYLAFYSKWLYWFGHNLHPWGAFKVKPFMPTVFGDGKVAQFTTHSYPTIGFYFLLGVFILLVLSVLIRRKAFKDAGSTSKA